MAFRSWNRGLAATTPSAGGASTPFGVWIFNGTRWFRDPTFPGSGVCKGNTVLWAGKLDYWLVGTHGDNWPSLCRFDAANSVWVPLPVPKATLARVTPAPNLSAGAGPAEANPAPDAGAITSGSCYSFDDCWFFGTYGSVVHWNGTALTDASPDPSQGWLATAFTAATARVDPGGNAFGAAVGGSVGPADLGPLGEGGTGMGTALPSQPDGTPPAQLYGSSGAVFGPVPFAAPTAAVPTDPYRTDLVAVDFGSDRQGWVAGNPAGLRAAQQTTAVTNPNLRPASRPAAGVTAGATAPSPLLTTTVSGARSTCNAPPATRFNYSRLRSGTDPTDAFLWSSISVIPGADNALAGGQMWPAATGPSPDEDGAAEPIVVEAECDGTTTTTRFRVADPNPVYAGSATALQAPADRGGTINAIAANAANDAWAATTSGALDDPANTQTSSYLEPPHLYRLTDGESPAAPAADDVEHRPVVLQLDPPPVPGPPPPAPPVPTPPPVVSQAPTRDPLPTVYDVKSTRRGNKHLKLYLTFRLRRPTMLGAEALRGGRVVSSTPLHRFTGRSGTLALAIDPKRYPTQVRFTTDSPTVRLTDPGRSLSGTVMLRAAPTPYHGRRIASVSFEYSPSGRGTWTTISTAASAPWTVAFATSGLAPAGYDLRAVATDNAGVSGVSPILAKRSVGNPAGG